MPPTFDRPGGAPDPVSGRPIVVDPDGLRHPAGPAGRRLDSDGWKGEPPGGHRHRAGQAAQPEAQGGEDYGFTTARFASVLALLNRRKDMTSSAARVPPRVFPLHRRKQLVSRIVEVDEQRIVDGKHLRGFLPSPHRLRDTLLPAVHDYGVSPLDQKALADLALSSRDITEDYIRPGLERLREVADKIAAFLPGKAGQRSTVLTIVLGEVG